LKDQLAVRNQPLVVRATMITLAAQKALVPLAARFHIGNGNERFGAHTDRVAIPLLGSAREPLERIHQCILFFREHGSQIDDQPVVLDAGDYRRLA
jgi:hypothetical protein